VLSGALETSVGTCESGGAVAVESGFAGAIKTLGPTELLHVGSSDRVVPGDGPFGAPVKGGARIHVVGSGGVYQGSRLDEQGVEMGAVLFADSTCPTCRLNFFRVYGTGPSTALSHVHSQPEIIHVLDGELRVGPTRVGRGMSIFIPENRRYGFRTPDAFEFLNYRRDVSYVTHGRDDEVLMETGEGLGMERATA
jgi:hypothetical protein